MKISKPGRSKSRTMPGHSSVTVFEARNSQRDEQNKLLIQRIIGIPAQNNELSEDQCANDPNAR